MKVTKTNAMRLLDQAGIPYEILTYEFDENDLSGLKAAAALKLPSASIFKTLVLAGERTGHLTACLPVDQEIDLKALAVLAGDKRVEMIAQKDLLPLTGYLRGGCSPVGMKKRWPTYICESALLLDKIAVSAGQRGIQMLLKPGDLIRFTGAKVGRFSRAID